MGGIKVVAYQGRKRKEAVNPKPNARVDRGIREEIVGADHGEGMKVKHNLFMDQWYNKKIKAEPFFCTNTSTTSHQK